LERNCT